MFADNRTDNVKAKSRLTDIQRCRQSYGQIDGQISRQNNSCRLTDGKIQMQTSGYVDEVFDRVIYIYIYIYIYLFIYYIYIYYMYT